MARKVRIEMSNEGVRELLKDPGVARAVEDVGDRFLRNAEVNARQDEPEAEFTGRTWYGFDRVHHTVRTGNAAARRAEANARALTRAVRGG